MSDRITRTEKSNRFLVLIWSVFFGVISMGLAVSIFSQRETKSGSNEDEVHVKSITCQSDDFIYPFFKDDEIVDEEFKIIVIFDGEIPRTLSLQQVLYYNDIESIKRSEAENHAIMNNSFDNDGLGADAVNATYSLLSNGMRFGLYGVYEKMSEIEMKYFLLEGVEQYDSETLKSAYEKMGLRCIDSN